MCGGDLVDAIVPAKQNGFYRFFCGPAAPRRAGQIAVTATIRDIDAACAFGEVATVEEWLDSGHHPDEAVTIKKYLREPIVQLNCLRLLCQRGRAKAPSGVLARLFSDPSLPRELFVHVLSFWRSVRASAEDRAFDRVRGRYLPTPYLRWYCYEAPDGVIMG